MKPERDSCSAFRASVIVRATFEAAGAFNPEFIPNDMVSALLVCAVSFADVARPAQADETQSSQRICHKANLRFAALREFPITQHLKHQPCQTGHELSIVRASTRVKRSSHLFFVLDLE